MANNYWCYLIDEDCVIAGFPIKRDDDAAILVVTRALVSLGCTGAELWNGQRRVWAVSNKGPKQECFAITCGALGLWFGAAAGDAEIIARFS
jgi:hypothetical protein